MPSDFAALYQTRLATLTAEHTIAAARARRHRLLFLTMAALTTLLIILALRGNLPARTILLPVAAALLALPFYLAVRSRLDRLDRLRALYHRAIDRSSGLHPQSGHTGKDLDAQNPHHLYSRDLQILGPDSLFGLLATTRTRSGREALARTLLHLPDAEETRARQLAIQELAPQVDLREQIALLGDHATHEIPSSQIHAWLAQAPADIPAITRPLLLITSTLAVLTLLAGLVHLAPWSLLRPNLAAILALQVALALRVRSRVSPILTSSKDLPRQTALLSQAIALIDRTPIETPALQILRDRVCNAAPALYRLNRTLSLLEQRNNQWFFLPALFLALGTQGSISIDRWRHQHAPDLRLWLDTFAEFEALNALATYAFEHPANTYPEILLSESPAAFHAAALTHPLLPPTVAVPNDISLDPTTRFYLISGSNMAGKSTLLRAIGTSTVLALSVADSLADGKSKFLAEVERLHAILQATRPQPSEAGAASPGAAIPLTATPPPETTLSTTTPPANTTFLTTTSPPQTALSTTAEASASCIHQTQQPTTPRPVLFLIDEIFSGTNSADRLSAATAVLHQLIQNGALGALSTHDLALTNLTRTTGRNLHMASPDPDDPLAFDYTLKPGINPSTNALAILRLIGIHP